VSRTFQRMALILLAPLLAFAMAARAALPAPPDAETGSLSPDLLESIERLDSADWQTREAADYELRDDDEVSLRDLEIALQTLDLSPEQRLRLLRVAGEEFLRVPRAAMGIRSSGAAGPGAGAGVEIIPAAQAGFHAHEVLNPGDRIVEADGVRIREFDDLRAAILRHDAGGVMQVTLIRMGRRMHVEVQLGDYGNLNNAAGLEPRILSRAWDLRSSEYDLTAHALANVADSGLTKAEWEGLGGEAYGNDSTRITTRTAHAARVRGQAEDPPAPGLRVGGSGRPFDPDAQPSQPQLSDLSVLRSSRARKIAQLAARESRLEDPDLSPRQKNALARQISRLRNDIAALERQIIERQALRSP